MALAHNFLLAAMTPARACALSNAQPDTPALAATVYRLVLDEGHDGVRDFGHYLSPELAQQARQVVKASLDEMHPPQEDGWLRSSQLRISAVPVLADLPELQRYIASVDLLSGEEQVSAAYSLSITPSQTPWHVLDAPVRFCRSGLCRAVASGPTPEAALHRARVAFERACLVGVPEHLGVLRRIQAEVEQEAAVRQGGQDGWNPDRDELARRVQAAFGEDAYQDEDLRAFQSRRFGL